MRPVQYHWDEMKIGPGAPPIKTDQGWLSIYHGVFQTMDGSVYRLGVALRDLRDPAKIIAVGDSWILQPEDPWETTGYMDATKLKIGQKIVMQSGIYGTEVKVVKITESCVEVELPRAEGPIGLQYWIRFDDNGKAVDRRDIYQGNIWGDNDRRIPGTSEFGPRELVDSLGERCPDKPSHLKGIQLWHSTLVRDFDCPDTIAARGGGPQND